MLEFQDLENIKKITAECVNDAFTKPCMPFNGEVNRTLSRDEISMELVKDTYQIRKERRLKEAERLVWNESRTGKAFRFVWSTSIGKGFIVVMCVIAFFSLVEALNYTIQEFFPHTTQKQTLEIMKKIVPEPEK